jgi:DNA-binding transcriptional ArsR family regulator
MFPDLLTYAPTVEAEFHLSLPQDLITSLLLLRVVDAFEGLSEWAYQTAAALPDDFRAELNVLGYPIKWCFRRRDSLIWRLPPEHPAHADVDALRAYLEATPATEYQRVLLLNLAQDAGQAPPLFHPDDAALRRTLSRARQLEREKRDQAFVDLGDDAHLVALVGQPQHFKERLIGLLIRFWEGYYRQDFERHREALAHSVAYHQRQTYPRNFSDLFRQVTGRALPPAVRDDVQEHLGQIERVIFSPCAHLGLYFQLTLSEPVLVVAFNYRTTPARETQGTATVELFPPLKALADESRLHILALLREREMYAQEIVEAVGLSQSTVSRHLQLLERTELVSTRQARGMKFYSINRSKGRAILEALGYLLG